MSAKFRPGYADPEGAIMTGFPGEGNIIIAEGATVPADATPNYAPGCLWFKRAGVGNAVVYANFGTVLSSLFLPLGTGTDLSGLVATAAELNRTAQNSSREVLAGATLTLSPALHDGRTVAMPAVCAITLPASTGSGARYKLYQKVAATTVTITATAADMYGNAWVVSDGAAAVLGYVAAGSTVISFNGNTLGGLKGATVELEDVATNLWLVRTMSAATGTEATPFS
jgi:hypothetical protein